jgi:heterodisulfide reductase subunit A
MAQFDKCFPTLDCAACILTPKMTQVRAHPNIELLTYSEVESVEPYDLRNFKVKNTAQGALRQRRHVHGMRPVR